MRISYGNYVQSDALLWFFDDKLKAQPWYARVDKSEGDIINQTPEVDLARLIASTPEVANLTTIISGLAKFYNTAHLKLQFDYHKSHIMIIKLLLSTVCSEDHRERAAVRGLQAYTGMNLLWHLWKCDENKPLKDVKDLESKWYIGKHLYHFFMDERSVTTWLSQSDPEYLREHTCAYFVDARVWLMEEQVWHGFEGLEYRRPNLTDASSAISPENANIDYWEKVSTSLKLIQTENTAELAPEAQEKGVSLQEGEPTGKTATESEVLDVSATTQDQPKSKITERPLLALVVRISASLWLEDFKWDASQAFLWMLTVAKEVSVSCL